MTQGHKILLVDDEQTVLDSLRPVLEVSGYEVATARSGSEAMTAIGEMKPDLMLLDLGLPDMDGKEIIDRTRRTSDLPIIVLSARGSEREKVDALDRGANDYIAKPFGVHELLARLRAVLRSAGAVSAADHFKSGCVELSCSERQLTIEGTIFHLSRKETELLRVLMRADGHVASHKQILSEIWGSDSDADTQYVRVLVTQLRQKICPDPSRPCFIITVPGLGYRFALPSDNR